MLSCLGMQHVSWIEFLSSDVVFSLFHQYQRWTLFLNGPFEKKSFCSVLQTVIETVTKCEQATFGDICYCYIQTEKYYIRFHCCSGGNIMQCCPHKRKPWMQGASSSSCCVPFLYIPFIYCFDLQSVFFSSILLSSLLYCLSIVSQWCSWAARSTPPKMALMLSSRSMAGATTPPPTARGPSSSLTSRGRASKRLLTGEWGSDVFFFFFIFFLVFRASCP